MKFTKTKIGYLVLGMMLLVLLLVESRGIGDLDIFISASKDLLAGGNIYDIKYHTHYYYFYDVLFALIISPLQFIPLFWANFIWLLFNVFFTYRIWKIILFYLPVDKLRKEQVRLLTVISFAFIFALWHKNIHLTQMTIFILYLCLEGIHLIKNEHPLAGSTLLGIGISIKILPIVIIPYLLYRGYFKASIYSMLATGIILFCPALIFGQEHLMFLLQERWNLINPLNTEHILDITERSFHSLTSLLSILLVENARGEFSLDLKRNIANVDLKTLSLIINIVRFCLIASVLFFIRALPFKRSSSKVQFLYEFSYILLITPLIFPHQQHYAFFFVFPAITYLVFYLILKYGESLKSKKGLLNKWPLLALMLGIFFLLNSHFILGAYRTIYDHFKTLSYGVLLLIPLLALVRPHRIDLLIREINE